MKSYTMLAFCTLGVQPQSLLQKTTSQFGKSFSLVLMFVLMCLGAQAQYTFAPVGTVGNLGSFSVAGQGGYSAPTLVDLNNDGKLDIVTGAQNGTFNYYQNNGTAVSMPATPGTPSWTNSVVNPFSGFDVGLRSSPAFVDIDGDLDQDMFSGNSIGEFKYYENVGTPSSPMFIERFFEDNPMWFEDLFNPGNYLPHNVGAVSTIGFLDADAIPDGDMDLVASNSQGQFFYFENEGDMFTPYFPERDLGAPRTFSLRASPQILQGSGNTLLNATVCIVDMNCDKINDVLSGSRNGAFQFRALETTGANGYDHRFNTVTGSPAPLSSSDVSGSTNDYSFPADGDLDGDGDIDFISGRFNGTFVYFQNTTCNTAPTFAFSSGPGCGGTYTVILPPSGTLTLLPADIGNPTGEDNNCPDAILPEDATVDFSLSTVNCSDVNGLVPITIRARNTVTGVKSSASCIVYVDVNDNILPAITPPIPTTPPSAPGDFCSATPYYIDLDANGMATMGTVDPNLVPNQFADNCPMTLSVLAQPPAAFQFNCTSITAPPFLPPNMVPYQIILQATDNSGNTGTCISNIIIRDVTAPTVAPLTLPTQNLGICVAQMGSATHNQPVFTVTDACGSILTPTASISPLVGVTQSGVYPNISWAFTAAGTYTITYSFSDNALTPNITTRTQTIVVANAPLYFNGACPTNQTVNVDPGVCTASVSWVAPVGRDCGLAEPGNNIGVSTIGTRTSPHIFPVGTETVVYTATKGANSIQCFFSVTVVDNIAPVASAWTTVNRTLPSVGSFANLSSNTFNMGTNCGVVVNWTPPTATVTDNCTPPNTLPTRRERFEFDAPGAPVAFVPTVGAPGSTFPAGTTRVTYDYVDAAGNASVSTYTFDIVVTDNTFPSITCPSPISTVTAPGLCYADVYLPKPTLVSDNCPLPTNAVAGPIYGPPGQNFPPGSDYWRFGIGSTMPVNFTVTDVSGNTATCTMTVTVRDNQKPVFSNCATADVLLNAMTQCSISYNLTHPLMTDNSMLCSSPMTYTLSISGATILATTPVTSGGGPLTLFFNEGVSRVRYLAIDAANNMDSCVYLVKVTNTVAPSFTLCPSFQGSIGNLPTDAGQCYLALTANSFATQLGAFGGGVGCDPGTFAFTRLPSTPLPIGTQLGLGTHVLKVVATDYSGNTASCQFSVTIQDLIVPTTSSTICGSTLNYNTDVNLCSTIPNFSPPVFTDNCGVASTTVTYVSPPSMTPVNYIAGSSLSKGMHIFTYTARDAANNPGFCTFTINVNDLQKPAFTNCPTGTQMVDVGVPSTCAGTYTRTLSATDNCSGIPVITPTPNVNISVDLDPLTLTPSIAMVTYTATDAAVPSNNTTCVITVQARDVSGPEVTGCPANQSLTIGSPSVCTLPHPTGWADPTVFADCTGPVTVVSGPVALSANLSPITVTGTASNRNAQFPTGVNTVTYTYRDNVSPTPNTSTCTFTVTVIEGVPPIINSCPNITVGTDATTCAKTITTAYLLSLPANQRPSATDLCSPMINYTTNLPTLGTSVNANSCINVTWTASDVSGNNTNCIQQVCVADLTLPSLICGAPYTITTLPNNNCVENNNNTYPVLLNPLFVPALPTPSDNCSSLGLTISREPGQPGQYCVGNHTLYWRVTDANNNTSSCAQSITVLANNSCVPSLPMLTVTSGQMVNLSDITGISFTPANCCLTPTFVSVRLIAGPPAAGPYPITISMPNPYTFTVSGTYTAEYTISCSNFRGDGGAESTMTFIRMVSVAVPTCVATITIPNASGVVVAPATTVAINLGTPTISFSPSGCSNDVSFTRTWLGNAIPQTHSFPVGTHSIIYTGFGGATTTQTVTVTSGSCAANQAPSISCPNPSITAPADAGQCYASRTNVNFGVINASDNCGALTVTNDSPSQLFVVNSPIMVTFTASNSQGSASCAKMVTVTPNAEICGNGIDDDCDGDIDEGSGNGGIMEALMTTDGAPRDSAGFSVAIAGGIAVVGAPRSDAPGLNAGKAYVFEFDGTSWSQVAIIDPADNVAGDLFGYSVATDGQNIVIGSPKHASKGAAYFYEYTGVLTFKNKVMGAFNGDDYGASVSIDGNYAVVGAPYFDNLSVSASGAAYVLNLSGATWVPLQTLTSNAGFGKVNGRFGHSVSLENNSIAVGALNENAGAITFAGAVYTFYKSGATWTTPGLRLTQTVPVQYAYLGASVAIDGDLLVAGAYNDRLGVAAGSRTGSAYLFKRTTANTNTFTQQSRLTGSDAITSDNFGWSVAVDGDEVLVGARFGGDFVGNDAGSVYHYTIPAVIPAAMMEDNQVVDVDFGDASDQFGFAVDIDAGTQIFGAPRHDEGGNIDRGVAYIVASDCGGNRPAISRNDRQDIEVAQAVRCFPNPSEDLVNIDITMDEANEVHIMVMDATGRLVSDIFHGTAEGVNRYYFDGSSVNSGMYYIRVESPAFFQIVPVAIVK